MYIDPQKEAMLWLGLFVGSFAFMCFTDSISVTGFIGGAVGGRVLIWLYEKFK